MHDRKREDDERARLMRGAEGTGTAQSSAQMPRQICPMTARPSHVALRDASGKRRAANQCQAVMMATR